MARTKPHTQFHKDGSVWARGQTLNGEMHGFWEWFRKDGVIMRSGSFEHGAQVGAWTTYDKAGKVYKVTQVKPAVAKPASKKSPAKAVTKTAAKPASRPKKKAEPSADEIIASIDHPLKADLALVRKAMLAADTSIADGAKWNSLSFRTTEWFGTWNWRAKDQIQLVLHLGAKAGKSADSAAIADPRGLLKWLGTDRAMASLGSGAVLKTNIPAFKSLIKAWIRAI